MIALIEEINKRFYYQENGLYNRYNITSAALKDRRAGHVHPNGYRRIAINGKLFLEHRLVWNMFYGEIPDGFILDHINRIRDDNNIFNLKLVTYKGNQWNRNALGFSWDKKNKLWHSSIKCDGKSYHLGRYDNMLDARAAYLNAKNYYHIDNVNLDNIKEGNCP